MKKYFAALVLVLSGCAAGPSPQYLAYQAYVDQTRPLAERGSVKWSDYYTGLYKKAAAAGAPGFVLAGYNEAIKASQEYEAGRLTKEEFGYRIRSLQSDSTSKQQAAAAQARAEQEQRDAAATTALQNSLAIMQANRSYTLPQQAPAPMATGGNAYIIGFLRNQDTNGSLRYCRYSNGVVTTISSTSICPLQDR